MTSKNVAEILKALKAVVADDPFLDLNEYGLYMAEPHDPVCPIACSWVSRCGFFDPCTYLIAPVENGEFVCFKGYMNHETDEEEWHKVDMPTIKELQALNVSWELKQWWLTSGPWEVTDYLRAHPYQGEPL